MQELKHAVQAAAKNLYGAEIEPELSRPAEQFGDYATNAALQLAKKAAKSPPEIARALAEDLQNQPGIKSVKIAGPGFINFRLTDEALQNAALNAVQLPKPLNGQEILVEFGDPNPFKEMHIGHLYSYIVGDAISSLLESNGAAVKRLSYHGDVGLHVAKAIYGLRSIQNQAGAETIELENYLGKAYSLGNQKYEDEPAAKREIDQINAEIYQKNNPEINKLHEKGSRISFEYFDKILDLLSISTDRRYLESEAIEPGLKAVKANIGKVFQESQGAVIYDGEKASLHTRVFITSKGLPTYETKDLGLTQLKDKDFPKADRSIIITANEQSDYFKVMLAALADIKPETARRTNHLSHGFVSLSTGKMSSRTGQVYPSMKLLLDVKEAVHKLYPDSKVRKEVTFGAVKFGFLKHRLGSDIVLDVKESISLEGQSGPYLQYAYARACSLLEKAQDKDQAEIGDLDESERSLARKLSEYPEVIDKAVTELMPHHICTYLYELAQNFNSFYEKSRIIGDQREAARLALVRAYKNVLASGLDILNIAAPEKM
ncbi:MAG TPA: arginine--tRNA ligase [Candidatus Saccharimonadales bacterium]|nr:arginine--tRNA ligase [Candidatus Saccharimonadales bacterium]